ncbi:hypothetical protein PENSPDRAFT_657185 [Peniophora sp. CONT]|nr:hypothetical protein PENSPDRAFT_657185 [Peniophora sp. CONT]
MVLVPVRQSVALGARRSLRSPRGRLLQPTIKLGLLAQCSYMARTAMSLLREVVRERHGCDGLSGSRPDFFPTLGELCVNGLYCP